jgi:phosphohistidine phosphatase
MLLYLVRHAKAKQRDPDAWPDDRERPLTKRGKAQFQRAARGLRRLAPEVDVVLSSRYTRAAQTAAVLAKAARWPTAVACPALEEEPAADAVDAARRAAAQGIKALALVGHNPQMEAIAALLVAAHEHASFEFETGAVACLEVPPELRPGSARLTWLAQPKMLRALD